MKRDAAVFAFPFLHSQSQVQYYIKDLVAMAFGMVSCDLIQLKCMGHE